MQTSLLDGRIKLRHLSCMIEVIRQGGVVAASKTLGLSQPAVSKSIAELEKQLGVQLFDRSNRQMKLTHEGVFFSQHAIAAAASLREGLENLNNMRTGRNAVRIGALPTVEVQVVPRAVARFMKQPLACTVQIESGPSVHLLNLLREGHLDFYVGRLSSPDVMHGLVFEQLYSDSVIFVVRPCHPFARKAHVSYQDLNNQTLVLPPPYAIIRQTVDSLLIAGGVDRSKREIETVSNGFARAYTLENDAVWVISRGVVAQDLIEGNLIALPLDTSNSQGPVGITRRANDKLSLPSEALIDSVRHIISEIEAMIGES